MIIREELVSENDRLCITKLMKKSKIRMNNILVAIGYGEIKGNGTENSAANIGVNSQYDQNGHAQVEEDLIFDLLLDL